MLFQMPLYRGVTDKRGKEFASDPGDFGRGEYWSSDPHVAKAYSSKVKCETIVLFNPIQLLEIEAYILADDMYGTIRGKNKIGSGCGEIKDRLENSSKLTADLVSLGHDGFVVYKESGEVEVVVFDKIERGEIMRDISLDEKAKKLEALIKIDELSKENKSYHEFLLEVGQLIFSLLSDEADF